ncbi:hypothetical protein KKA85_13325 [bacterium]|nr:hypothetical protein [bacterium]MBU1676745.1 hypothetical protein [bacterium]
MFIPKLLPLRMAILLAVLACAVPALAGTQLLAGFTLPVGDLNDGADVGYHGGVSMHFPVVPLTFSAGPTVIYNRLPGSGDDSFSFLEVLATGSLTIPAGPAVFGGLGYTFPSAEVGGVDLDPDTEFTIVIGTGTKFALLEIKGLWHHLGDTDFLTISAGLGF